MRAPVITLPGFIGMRGKRGPLWVLVLFLGFSALTAQRLGDPGPVVEAVVWAAWTYSALAVVSLLLHVVCDFLATVAYYQGSAPAPAGLLDLGAPRAPRPVVDPLAPVLVVPPATCPECDDPGTVGLVSGWFCSACGFEPTNPLAVSRG